MNCQGESGSYEGVDEYNTWSSLRLSTPMFSEMFVQVDDLYHQLFFNQVYYKPTVTEKPRSGKKHKPQTIKQRA